MNRLTGHLKILIPIVLLYTPCWGETPSDQETPSPSTHKNFTIQIGTYTTLRKAALMRTLLKEISSIQVEKIQNENKEPLYRVLVGQFSSMEEAEHFIKAYRLKDLFKDVWVNAMTIDSTNDPVRGEIVPAEVLDQDPYIVQLDLHCENNKKYGVYKTEIHPDEKDPNRDIDLNIHWNCIPNPSERWLAKDEERSPSHFSIGVLAGAGSLGITDNTIGTASRNDFSYGFEIGAFKSFGGMGPTFEYRLINHRYSNSDINSAEFFVTHRFLVGARLPISHRLEFQPLLGFYTEGFLQGTSDSTATLVDPLLPQMGIRATFHLIELDEQAWFDLIGSYHYLFPAVTTNFNLNGGYEYSFKIQTSSFFPDNLGVNWFFEFSSRTISSTTFTQSDTLFLAGVTALIAF